MPLETDLSLHLMAAPLRACHKHWKTVITNFARKKCRYIFEYITKAFGLVSDESIFLSIDYDTHYSALL